MILLHVEKMKGALLVMIRSWSWIMTYTKNLVGKTTKCNTAVRFGVDIGKLMFRLCVLRNKVTGSVPFVKSRNEHIQVTEVRRDTICEYTSNRSLVWYDV